MAQWPCVQNAQRGPERQLNGPCVQNGQQGPKRWLKGLMCRMLNGYQEDGSIIKTTFCSSQGTEFGPHHLCPVTLDEGI